jgi:hypothetical protein
VKLGENHVDEIMCLMSGTPEENAIVGFYPQPVRVGMGGLSGGSWEPDRIPSLPKEICLSRSSHPSSLKSVQF